MYTIFQRTEIQEPALFNPTDTTKKIKNFPEICISTFSDNIIQKFSSLDNVEKIAELYSASGALPVYQINYKNTAIAFYRSMVGAPACVACFEEIEADAHSIHILENVLTKCGYSYVKGKAWTSDAIYREALSAIEERRQEDCLAIEMECASMLAVSKYRHIPFIQFLYGADNLNSETWEIRDLISYGLTNAEKYMILAFECGLAM